MSKRNGTTRTLTKVKNHTDTEYVLELDSLTMQFGGVTAVNDVSIKLRAGERLAVIGPNGAGKTTLFKMIAGEIRPTVGTVTLFNEDVTQLSDYQRARRGLSRTFQVSNLLPELSVLDNVRVAAQAQKPQRWRFWWPQQPSDDVTHAALAALEKVALHESRNTQVSDLSHGAQRQVEIAMALVTQPKLLLLDEPAAGLAMGERILLRQLLEELPETLPYLLIEHDMTLALELADRVLCLNNGSEVMIGTPGEIKESEEVQEIYLGRGG